jgi:outer membrane protein assembly factor BamB
MKATFIALLACSFCLPLIAADNSAAKGNYWPGWLGPERDGWVKGFQPPKKWPAKLKRVWQLRVGTGYGTPVVVGDKVYQHARQDEAEVVWSIDLKTGKKVWRSSHNTSFKMGGGGEKHGKGPKSNPIYSDGRLFVMSITGNLSSWDAASGKLIWRKDYNSRFKPSYPKWGMCNSPVVDGDRVITHFGNVEKGVLVALDVKTGKEIWTQGEDGPCYSSPLLVEHEGVRQVIEWNHRALVGVESKSGKLLWEFPFPHIGTNQNMPTPSFAKGRILLGGENRGLHGIEPKLENGKWTVKAYWSHRKVALDMSSAVVNEGRLFGLSHLSRSRYFCADSHTGEVLWQGPERAGENATFLAFPGHVMALANHGELQVLAAKSDVYKKVASWKVSDNRTWAAPVLLGEGILIKDHEHLTYWSFN